MDEQDKLQFCAGLDAELRDARRLGRPTGALLEQREALIKARSQSPAQARDSPVPAELWHSEHYHRREK